LEADDVWIFSWFSRYVNTFTKDFVLLRYFIEKFEFKRESQKEIFLEKLHLIYRTYLEIEFEEFEKQTKRMKKWRI